jgi:hypothetical protein
MDDQSQWKKELSFGRKPKEQTDADESPVTDAKPTSPFKKELSFKRKDEGDVDAVAAAPADEPEVEEPVAAEPQVAEETVWKKEVSFGRKAAHEDAVVEAEPDVIEAATDEVIPDEQATDPETGLEETVWKKEVSFSRTPAAEPVAEQSPVEVPVADEAPVAHDEPVAQDEPVPEEEAVVVEESVALKSVEVEAAAEPWDAPPAMPPAPVTEALVPSVPAPMPSEVVQPPVAAADLPPIVGEDGPKVPFWKKELSLGGKKGD